MDYFNLNLNLRLLAHYAILRDFFLFVIFVPEKFQIDPWDKKSWLDLSPAFLDQYKLSYEPLQSKPKPKIFWPSKKLRDFLEQYFWT